MRSSWTAGWVDQNDDGDDGKRRGGTVAAKRRAMQCGARSNKGWARKVAPKAHIVETCAALRKIARKVVVSARR
jgi:hypothetical protein